MSQPNDETPQSSPTTTHPTPTSESPEQSLLFSCQSPSAGQIGTLLSCLRLVASKSHTSKIQHATVYAGPNGLTFHCLQSAKQSQCSVDLPKGLFGEYFVGEEEVWLEDSDDDNDDDNDSNDNDNNNGDDNNKNGDGRASQKTLKSKEIIKGGEFGINLTTVLECFSVLSKNHKIKPSSSTSTPGEYATLNSIPLCMSYDRSTATLHLEFLDSLGCLVTCEVPGVATEDNNAGGLASAFRSSPLVGRAILFSDGLYSAVGELNEVIGGNVVVVKFCRGGVELGTVGPRSEVWISIPYNSSKGMYVGLECFRDDEMVWRYSLSAFLTGMRGLDIGCETCISVNERGMMAIQHQISREEGEYGSGVRPSFVDFIMNCIEDEVEEHDGDESLGRGEMRRGIRDVTNDVSVQEESVMGRSASSSKHRKRGQSQRSSNKETSPQSSDDDQDDADVSFRDDNTTEHAENDDTETNTRSTATSRILGELEVDKDMLTSNTSGVSKRKRSALADIRRRRELRQSMNKKGDTDDESQDSTHNRQNSSRKRHSSSRNQHESDSDESTANHHSSRKQKHDTPQDTTNYDSQSESSSQSEPDSLDVTTEIPLFKSSSMRTSRHGRANSDSEAEAEEPRMMYGDTKLEFTQDGYGSDDS